MEVIIRLAVFKLPVSPGFFPLFLQSLSGERFRRYKYHVSVIKVSLKLCVGVFFLLF